MFPMTGSVTASQIWPISGTSPASAAGIPMALIRNTVKKELMMTKAPPLKNSPMPYIICEPSPTLCVFLLLIKNLLLCFQS